MIKKVLDKYNKIWDRVKSLFGKKSIVNQCIMINTLKLK